MSTSPTYSLVLLGATGYTGKLCAEHITKHFPTNLKWAIAGRSISKLDSIVDDLKKLNPDRIQPDALQVNLNKKELGNLARQAIVLVNCVGPYHLYSTPVVAACAENGTHYLDVTGETPWVREILQKYHQTAKSSGAILIPEIGVESAPSDLMGYMIASTIRGTLKCGVRDVVCAIHEMKNANASGGTLATALGLIENYSFADLGACLKPFVLSPATAAEQQTKKHPAPKSFLSRVLGPFSYPYLGILTTSLQAPPNVAIVQRSSSLMPELYGSDFRFHEYMEVSNYAKGILVHFAIMFASLVILIKPIRSLIRRFIYQPGQGPAAEAEAKAVLEYRAIGVAENETGSSANTVDEEQKDRRAKAKFRFEGGMYYLTAVLVTEGAMVLLENRDLADRLGGGLLTPACLGYSYVKRLQAANVHIEAGMVKGS